MSKRALTVTFCLFCLLAGWILYFKTLEAPWYFDDFHNIVNNDGIKRLDRAIRGLFGFRGISFFTFYLNHSFGGLDVSGYHLVNILVHILCAILCFLLLQTVYAGNLLPAMTGATIFLVHPIQTQAVTYIVQRMASLSALFFLASILFFVKARQTSSQDQPGSSGRRAFCYGISLLFGVFAVLSKENAAVLPLALLLVETLFLPREESGLRRSLARVAPYFAIPVFLLLQQILADQSTLKQVGTGVEYFLPAADGSGRLIVTKTPDLLISRYLATQFIVIWMYMKMLVLPFGQMLDYCYPLVADIVNVKSLAGLTGIAVSVFAAIKVRTINPRLTFGVIWILLTLLVESSIIPLDPVFEHRLYLPMLGFAVLSNELFYGLFSTRTALVGIVLYCVFLSVMTWKRNLLWTDPIAFWSDNVAKAPMAYRPKISLAKELIEAGKANPVLLDGARPLLEEAIALKPDNEVSFRDLGHYYVVKKDFVTARMAFEKAYALNSSNVVNLVNLGAVAMDLGEYDKAVVFAGKALRVDPNNRVARTIINQAEAALTKRVQ